MPAKIIEMGQYQAPVVLPSELKSKNLWLVWRLFHPPGTKKPKKLPHYINGEPRSGQQGSKTDLDQLSTFARAVKELTSGDRWTGLGIAITKGCGLVALDFDDCVSDGAIAPYVLPFMEDTYSEFSPSGNGIRVFFTGDLMSNKDTEPKYGSFPIEVFGDSGFVTVTGNVTPYCELFGLRETVAPVSTTVLKELASRGWSTGPSGSQAVIYRTDLPEFPVSDDAVKGPVPLSNRPANAMEGLGQGLDSLDADLSTLDTSTRLGVSIEEMEADLAVLPANAGREQWSNICAAIHHEAHGSEAGFQLFLRWSKGGGDSFAGEADCRSCYQSWGKRTVATPMTFGFVKKLVREQQVHQKYTAVDQLKNGVAAATSEFELREVLCKEIKKDPRLDGPGREHLAEALFQKFKALGLKLPIGECRKLIAPPKNELKKTDFPEWAKGWYYVTDDDKFFRVDTDEWLSMVSFNAKFNRYVRTSEEDAEKGFERTAAWYALEVLHIKTVTRGMYLPQANGFELRESGTDVVNIYRPSSVPQAAEVYTPEGKEAVQAVIKHIEAICGGRREVVVSLISWLAHNVQKPGVKIRWAPLIIGMEGDGKTLLAKMMSIVMGRPNVKSVSSTVLGDSSFTPWGEGSCVAMLQEVRIVGANKFDIFNKLKVYISDDEVPIHPKGSHEYNIINVTNYCAFSNYKDALPVNDNDRRWFVVFTPYSNVGELAAAHGGEAGLYFDRLHHLIETQGAALRKWLLEVPLVEFKPNGRAPYTTERDIIVAMAGNGEDDVVRDVLAHGAPGVASDVLCISYLITAVQLAGCDVDFRTSAMPKIITRLGWVKWPTRKRFNGKPEWWWTKGQMNELEMAAKLERTLVPGAGNLERGDIFAL